MKSKIDGILNSICVHEGLTLDTQLTLGNVCEFVFRGHRADGSSAILKVGTDQASKDEIAENLSGYRSMDALGVSQLAPRVFSTQTTGDAHYILMEDCGDDFYTQAKKSLAPEDLYTTLAAAMGSIYEQTLRPSNAGKQMVMVVVALVGEQYKNYLQKAFDPMRLITAQLAQLVSTFEATPLTHACFANWDFTPEDVYLQRNQVRYSDPKDSVLGLPTIDLACFAGVSRDVYHLPGSDKGYAQLERLATRQVAQLFSITQWDAEKYFALGRLLQSFLSARVRIQNDPNQAHKFYDIGCSFLLKVLS
ncbi:MAG: hypothetical protein HYW97_00180 [Candidatus Wildermuthbacteria bacterium]|nr:hypothetical protein [Candidatus Wildermuthbacteria bacterium]